MMKVPVLTQVDVVVVGGCTAGVAAAVRTRAVVRRSRVRWESMVAWEVAKICVRLKST